MFYASCKATGPNHPDHRISLLLPLGTIFDKLTTTLRPTFMRTIGGFTASWDIPHRTPSTPYETLRYTDDETKNTRHV